MPLVHAVPGFSPILPMISMTLSGDIFTKEMASFPLKFVALQLLAVPVYKVAAEFLKTAVPFAGIVPESVTS